MFNQQQLKDANPSRPSSPVVKRKNIDSNYSDDEEEEEEVLRNNRKIKHSSSAKTSLGSPKLEKLRHSGANNSRANTAPVTYE